ncbi:MAG: methyltransferase domain-containing protein [Candidatus Ancaeobacter aquaticus]|nr:methyltransferase domain-containing protein [Candidatus Ancaeobacter aquaticus]
MTEKNITRSKNIRKAAKDQFNSWAAGYDSSILQHILFKHSHDLIMKEIDLVASHHILDVGCGTCVLAFRFAAESPESTCCCIDLSHEMIKHAMGKREEHLHYSDAIKGMKIKIADSEHLPYADNSFDYLTCSNSFHHYPHQEKVAREMYRVLKPGGKALIVDGYKDNVLGGMIYDGIVTFIEGDVHHLNSRQFKDLFGKIGFEPITHKKSFKGMPVMLIIATAKK